MDHSYRQTQGAQGNTQGGGGYGRPRFGDPQRFHQSVLPDPEPLPPNENGATRILAMVDDLFFVTKIQETARKLNVKVEFTKTDKDILERIEANGQEKPSLIIIDLNSVNAKPLTTIPKLKAKLKKGTSILGFVSHVQGDLKVKAQEAGCDSVMPRSAFSQNLPQLLRRHGAPEDLTQTPE
jgi:CheY-like chemotaxis protein